MMKQREDEDHEYQYRHHEQKQQAGPESEMKPVLMVEEDWKAVMMMA